MIKLKNFPPLPEIQVASFDPGGTTGVAIYNGSSMDSLITASLSVEDMLLKCSMDAFRILPKIWVIEEFRIYPWAAGKLAFDDVISAQLIGMLRIAARRCEAKIIMQSAQNAKNFGTNERLDGYGWTKFFGSRHEKDAGRHLLYYLLKGRNAK